VDKIMKRFKSQFSKLFSAKLARIDERRYLKDQEIRDLYEFIGVNIPDESDIEVASTRLTQKALQKSETQARYGLFPCDRNSPDKRVLGDQAAFIARNVMSQCHPQTTLPREIHRYLKLIRLFHLRKFADSNIENNQKGGTQTHCCELRTGANTIQSRVVRFSTLYLAFFRSHYSVY
jgi:hypothetical protein